MARKIVITSGKGGVGKTTVVVNLAAQAGVRYSITNPGAYMESNMVGFFNILEACRHYFKETGRRVSFEYTLIAGKNDSPEAASRLATLLNSRLRDRNARDAMPIHVNLIPVNEVEETGFSRSSDEAVKAFAAVLEKRGIRATVRRKLGADINASCGQLRRKQAKESAQQL